MRRKVILVCCMRQRSKKVVLLRLYILLVKIWTMRRWAYHSKLLSSNLLNICNCFQFRGVCSIKVQPLTVRSQWLFLLTRQFYHLWYQVLKKSNKIWRKKTHILPVNCRLTMLIYILFVCFCFCFCFFFFFNPVVCSRLYPNILMVAHF